MRTIVAAATTGRTGMGEVEVGTAAVDQSKCMGEMGVAAVADRPGVGVVATGAADSFRATVVAVERRGMGAVAAAADQSKGMGVMAAAVDRLGMGAATVGVEDQSKGMESILLFQDFTLMLHLLVQSI